MNLSKADLDTLEDKNTDLYDEYDEYKLNMGKIQLALSERTLKLAKQDLTVAKKELAVAEQELNNSTRRLVLAKAE